MRVLWPAAHGVTLCADGEKVLDDSEVVGMVLVVCNGLEASCRYLESIKIPKVVSSRCLSTFQRPDMPQLSLNDPDNIRLDNNCRSNAMNPHIVGQQRSIQTGLDILQIIISKYFTLNSIYPFLP